MPKRGPQLSLYFCLALWYHAPVMILRLTLIFTLALVTAAPSMAEPFTVKWGIVLPLSGGTARAGVDIQRGFELAREEHRSKQVLHEFVYEDSQYKNRETASAAQKLLSVDKVDVIVAVWDTADIVAPFAERANRLHTSIRWNSNIAERFKNTFTFESTYKDYARHFAELFNSVKLTNISILNHESNGWNLARDAFVKDAEELGLNIVSSQNYLPEENDFNAYAVRALKAKPDVVLINDVAEKLEQITRALRVVNPKQRVTGYLDYPLDLSLYEGEYFVNQLSLDPAFAKKYQERYKEPLYTRGQLGYDLFAIVAAAYEKFKVKPSTAEIVERLGEPTNYEGASGTITNSEHHKVFRTTCNFMQVVNGKKVKVESLGDL